MTEQIRAFIAIELSKEIHKELAAILEKLKPIPGKINWVKSDNIHLTLKFLGDTTPEQVEEIKKIMGEIKTNFRPFKLTLGELGGFPRLNFPRVIWVGINKGAKESTDLANCLEEKLPVLGFQKEERPFHPHLTLGRVKFMKDNTAYRQIIEKIPRTLAPIEMQAEGITLFQSTLTPQGSLYAPLYNSVFEKH